MSRETSSPDGPAPRVAVTGLGLMTGLGLDLESSWRGLAAGKTPAGPFRAFDPSGLPCTFGVELPEGADELFARSIKTRSRSQMTRCTMMAVVTAGEAIGDARLEPSTPERERVGVVIGATGTGYAPGPGLDEHRILRAMANAPAAWISLKWRLAGPSFVVSTACASGAYALQSAFHLIVTGQCDAVVCGAVDSCVNYLDVQGFSSLMALSEEKERFAEASRPFDRRRSGFVMGEGAGMLVLESVAHARRRGARIRAEMPMPALASESYNILSPEPDGAGMARTMALALRHAGLAPGRIDYINAHGTSTPLNDRCETMAIKAVFGEAARRVPVSSTKSMTGHCLSGAAGVEAVISCKALEEGLIPPTMNLKDPDPELDLDYVPLEARRADLRHVMSNAFAFGGHNGVVIFSRVEP
jgi:3-oxoacyl-[acyl-carrier-protein] synthase II